MFIHSSRRVVLLGVLFLVVDDANGRRAPSSAVGEAIKIGGGQHQTGSDDKLSFGLVYGLGARKQYSLMA